MYSFDSRVRYSETDPQGKLKIEALINYFQDCCSFQSEAGGVGLEYTKEHHIAWLVNFWQIEILRRPALGEYVRTTTIPYDFKAFLGYRNCVMEALPVAEDAGGSVKAEHAGASAPDHVQDEPCPEGAADSVKEKHARAFAPDRVQDEPHPEAAADRAKAEHGSKYLAVSNSVWSLIDLERGLPVRIPPEMFAAYPLDPKIDMEYLPRKIALPKTPEAAKAAGMKVTQAEPVPVTASMIDSNHHVNNGQYVRLALSFFPDESSIRRVCVEYVRQARQGDVIVPVIYTQNPASTADTCPQHTIALCSQADRKPFAIVQVMGWQ